jgi:gas vesicle protein
MDKECGGGFGIGLLVGAALGVAAGLLFAPQSGKETRQMLQDKCMNAKEKMATMMHKNESQASEPAE